MRPVDEVCEYVKVGGLHGTEEDLTGSVHLAAKVFLQSGKITRESGDFLCSKARGAAAKNRRNVTRGQFRLEPCPGCLEKAEKLSVEVGSLWHVMRGPLVSLYTTSPEKRDRPYMVRKEVVGEYMGRDVVRVLVPGEEEGFVIIAKKWLQRDAYHVWDEERWRSLVKGGAATLG
jgi:hypothetical protein